MGKQQQNNKIISLWPIAIFIVIAFFIFFIYGPFSHNQLQEDIYKTYASSISGVVLSKKVSGGYTTIKMNYGIKFILENSRNYNFEPKFIGDFIQISDSLKKEAFSDDVIICRNGQKYQFELGNRQLNK
jgi:hypothetical protein